MSRISMVLHPGPCLSDGVGLDVPDLPGFMGHKDSSSHCSERVEKESSLKQNKRSQG